MPPLRFADPESAPTNVLFPEAYEDSKRTIVRDFAFFGTVTILAIVLAAVVSLASQV